MSMPPYGGLPEATRSAGGDSRGRDLAPDRDSPFLHCCLAQKKAALADRPCCRYRGAGILRQWFFHCFTLETFWMELIF